MLLTPSTANVPVSSSSIAVLLSGWTSSTVPCIHTSDTGRERPPLSRRVQPSPLSAAPRPSAARSCPDSTLTGGGRFFSADAITDRRSGFCITRGSAGKLPAHWHFKSLISSSISSSSSSSSSSYIINSSAMRERALAEQLPSNSIHVPKHYPSATPLLLHFEYHSRGPPVIHIVE
ncbi:hypothetical protein EYF80_021682 [Liparis tanakae]|uniref:Uncharacterized protein n=1 Tax=Liparis tanakae TaxID=230148 RepID=A0A4Z2HQP1_9TELE|nr:hypothetical protein EYF80_021682 [Liparis tanakae]